MSTNLFGYLEHIGASRKEIDVYLYLLSVESALPMEIAEETKLKRSTVYVILDLLKEKGLIREIQRGKRCAYVAEDPDRIKFLLEELRIRTEKNIRDLDVILPQLKATLRKSGQPPLIKFYEGESAVQVSMHELVSNPKFRSEMDYGVFPLELVYKLFRSNKLRQFIDFRLTDNNHYKIIYTSDEGEIAARENQEAVRVDQKEFPFSCDISIFEDEVRIHMLGKTVYGILIKNPEFAETLTSLFKLAIRGSKPNSNK